MNAVAPLALPAAFQQSNVDYLAVLPLLIVFGTALVGVLVEAFAPRERRQVIQVTLSVVGLLAAAASIIVAADHQGLTLGLTGASGHQLFALAIDGPALFMQGTILLLGVNASGPTPPKRSAIVRTPSTPSSRIVPCMNSAGPSIARAKSW